MLGESHSLINEFPNLIKEINTLYKKDPSFAEKAVKYDELDSEIRRIELDNSPIADGTMQQMKHDRSVLKDFLYKVLLDAKNASKN